MDGFTEVTDPELLNQLEGDSGPSYAPVEDPELLKLLESDTPVDISLKQRGRQVVAGATESIASLPESAAITGASLDYKVKQNADTAIGMRQERIALLEDAIRTNTDMPDEQRAWMQSQIDALRGGVEVSEDLKTKPIVPARQRDIYAYGDKIRGAVEDTVGKPDPRDDSFVGKLAYGVGNVGGIVTTSLAASAVGGPWAGIFAGGAQGVAMNQSQVYKEALESGVDEETALAASDYAAMVGATEIIPISRALKLFPASVRKELTNTIFKRVIELGKNGAEEGIQEYLSQVGNNIIAQQYYDPDRGWTEGAGEAALVGAILGTGVGAVGQALEGKKVEQVGDSAPSNEQKDALTGTGGTTVDPSVDPAVAQAVAGEAVTLGQTPKASAVIERARQIAEQRAAAASAAAPTAESNSAAPAQPPAAEQAQQVVSPTTEAATEPPEAGVEANPAAPTPPAEQPAAEQPAAEPPAEAEVPPPSRGNFYADSPETIKFQHSALLDPKNDRKVVMYSSEMKLGELPDKPKPAYIKRYQFKVDGKTVYFDVNTAKTNYGEVQKAVRTGKLNELLDLGPYDMQQVASSAATGAPSVAVVERTPDGTEVKAAAGTTETVPEQVAVLEQTKSAPENTIVADDPQAVINDRRAASGVRKVDPNTLSDEERARYGMTPRAAPGGKRILEDLSPEGKAKKAAAEKAEAARVAAQIKKDKDKAEAELREAESETKREEVKGKAEKGEYATVEDEADARLDIGNTNWESNERAAARTAARITKDVFDIAVPNMPEVVENNSIAQMASFLRQAVALGNARFADAMKAAKENGAKLSDKGEAFLKIRAKAGYDTVTGHGVWLAEAKRMLRRAENIPQSETKRKELLSDLNAFISATEALKVGDDNQIRNLRQEGNAGLERTESSDNDRKDFDQEIAQASAGDDEKSAVRAEEDAAGRTYSGEVNDADANDALAKADLATGQSTRVQRDEPVEEGVDYTIGAVKEVKQVAAGTREARKLGVEVDRSNLKAALRPRRLMRVNGQTSPQDETVLPLDENDVVERYSLTEAVGMTADLGEVSDVSRKIISRILDRVSERIGKVPVKFVHQETLDAMYPDREPGNVNGFYDPEKGHIVLSTDFLKSGEIDARLLTHEAVHAYLQDAVDRHPELKKDIIEIRDYVRSQSKVKDLYGFKDAHEFLSEALSNPEFQKLLMDTQVPMRLAKKFDLGPDGSLWDGLMSVIADFLGIGRRGLDALTYTLRLAERAEDRRNQGEAELRAELASMNLLSEGRQKQGMAAITAASKDLADGKITEEEYDAIVDKVVKTLDRKPAPNNTEYTRRTESKLSPSAMENIVSMRLKEKYQRLARFQKDLADTLSGKIREKKPRNLKAPNPSDPDYDAKLERWMAQQDKNAAIEPVTPPAQIERAIKDLSKSIEKDEAQLADIRGGNNRVQKPVTKRLLSEGRQKRDILAALEKALEADGYLEGSNLESAMEAVARHGRNNKQLLRKRGMSPATEKLVDEYFQHIENVADRAKRRHKGEVFSDETLHTVSLADALARVFDTTPGRPFLRDVNRTILEKITNRVIEVIPDVEVKVVGQKTLDLMFPLMPKGSVRGFYDYNYNHIVIQESSFANGKFDTRLIVHEAVHAYLYDAIDSDKNLKADIQEVLDIAREYADAASKSAYGFTDVQEFIAEALTNRDFQNVLLGIKLPQSFRAKYGSGVDSLWNYLVDVIRKHFGLPKESNDALSYVMRLVDRAEQQRPEVRAGKSGVVLFNLGRGSRDYKAELTAAGVPDETAAELVQFIENDLQSILPGDVDGFIADLVKEFGKPTSESKPPKKTKEVKAAVEKEAKKIIRKVEKSAKELADEAYAEALEAFKPGRVPKPRNKYLLKLLMNNQLALISDNVFGRDTNPVRRIADLLEQRRTAKARHRDELAVVPDELREAERAYTSGRAEVRRDGNLLEVSRKKQQQIWEDFVGLAHDSTMAQVHPDKPLDDEAHKHLGKNAMNGKWGKEQHPKLAARYEALPDDLKVLFAKTRDVLTETQNKIGLEKMRVILKAIGHDDVALAKRFFEGADTPQDRAKVGDIVAQHIKSAGELTKLAGPYFNLVRRGDWVVQGTYKITVPSNGKKIADNIIEFKSKDDAEEFAKKQDLRPTINSVIVDTKTGETFFTDDDGTEVKATLNDPDAEQRWRVTVQNRHVEFFNSKKEAQRTAKELREAGVEVKDVEAKRFERDAANGDMLSDQMRALASTLEAQIAYKNLTPTEKSVIRNTLNEASLRFLSSTRIQSNRLPRRYVQGASKDLVLNTMEYIDSASGYLAKLDTQLKLEEAMRQMEQAVSQLGGRGQGLGTAARNIANEVSDRVLDVDYDRGFAAPIADRMMMVNFINHLASPFYSVLQTMQVGMLTLPKMAAEYGELRTAGTLAKAYYDIGAGRRALKGVGATAMAVVGSKTPGRTYVDDVKGSLKDANEKKLIDDLVDLGVIDADAGFEVNRLTRKDSAIVRGVDATLDYFGSIARQAPQAIEAINRTVTALATYRLEMAKHGNYEKAKRAAQEMTELTQFNLSSSNAAPIFQNSLGRLLLQFKKYGQNAYFLLGRELGRAIRPMNKGDRVKGIKSIAYLLATHQVMAGFLGLPWEPVKVGIMLFNALGLTDMEWDDFENLVQEFVKELLGDEEGDATEAFVFGLPRLLDMNLSPRVGLSDLLLFGEPGNMQERDSVRSWMFNLIAGPSAGSVQDGFDGVNAVLEGKFLEGFEKLATVKVIGDTARAARELDEGKFDVSDAVMRAIGVQSARQARIQDKRGDTIDARTKVKQERKKIINDWLDADTAAERAKVVARMREYNRSAGKRDQLSVKFLRRISENERRQYEE